MEQKAAPLAAAKTAAADVADDEDTTVLSPKKGKPGGKPAEQMLTADDLDDDGDTESAKPIMAQQSDKPSWKKKFVAVDEEEDETSLSASAAKAKACSQHKASHLRCPQALLL